MNQISSTTVLSEASGFHAQFERADWAATPLGPLPAWPAALRANVALMLDARIAMGLVWGPQRCLIYNEAYTSLLGEKHPRAQGRPVAEVWSEIWPFLEPLVDSACKGVACDVQDVPLKIRRRGGLEQGWFTIYLSPLRDDDGVVRGLCSTVIETTARMRAEGEVRALNERHEAQAQARASAERLQLATEAGNLGIWSWDVATDRVIWENERMHEMMGVPKGGAPVNVARYIAEFAHPDDIEGYRQAIEHSLATGQPYHHESRFRRPPDGELRWLEFTGKVYYDEHGKPLRMLGTAADVTERKRVIEQLRDAQARLEATLGAAEIGTWLFDLRGFKLYADANMARLHGLSEADVVAASPLAYMTVIHPDDLPAVRAAVAHARTTGQPYDCTYRVQAGGQERVIHARGKVEYEDGAPAWLPGVVIDITRQTSIEAQLRAREQHYRTLITSIDEGFCLVELVYDEAGRAVDHRVLETNPAFERHTGVADAAGKTASELAPGIEQHWNDLYAGVARSGESVRTVLYNEVQARWFDVFVGKAEGGRDDLVAVVFRDITAQRKADEALRALADDLARANRRQTEFLATLAHELRNPLAPIRSGLDLMRLAPGNAASAERVRGMMERQVNHLIHLVNDLLDLARIQSGKIELKRAHVRLREIVADSVEASLPLVESRAHALQVDADDDSLWVDADPNRLVQVIGNLLTNAAKYTPEGGRITLALRREGANAAIEVSDDGIGIPPESLPGLFEMFSQCRNGSGYAQGGLGIGLSLVKRLVEQHGGSVTVESAGTGLGSRFTVRIPLAPRPESNDPNSDS